MLTTNTVVKVTAGLYRGRVGTVVRPSSTGSGEFHVLFPGYVTADHTAFPPTMLEVIA